jgi:hypothetical protein
VAVIDAAILWVTIAMATGFGLAGFIFDDIQLLSAALMSLLIGTPVEILPVDTA